MFLTMLSLIGLSSASTFVTEQCIGTWKSCHFVKFTKEQVSLCTHTDEKIEDILNCKNPGDCAQKMRDSTCQQVKAELRHDQNRHHISFVFEQDIDFHQSYYVDLFYTDHTQSAVLLHSSLNDKKIHTLQTALKIKSANPGCGRLEAKLHRLKPAWVDCVDLALRYSMDFDEPDQATYDAILRDCAPPLIPTLREAKKMSCSVNDRFIMRINRMSPKYSHMDLADTVGE